MSRMSVDEQQFRDSAPRVSGDEPDEDDETAAMDWCSPRERG